MKAVRAETKGKQFKVLEILEQKGYRWCLGQKPTDYVPYELNGHEFHYIKIDEAKKNTKNSNKTISGTRRNSIPTIHFQKKKR